jgi:hypothetical protein
MSEHACPCTEMDKTPHPPTPCPCAPGCPCRRQPPLGALDVGRHAGLWPIEKASREELAELYPPPGAIDPKDFYRRVRRSELVEAWGRFVAGAQPPLVPPKRRTRQLIRTCGSIAHSAK